MLESLCDSNHACSQGQTGVRLKLVLPSENRLLWCRCLHAVLMREMWCSPQVLRLDSFFSDHCRCSYNSWASVYLVQTRRCRLLLNSLKLGANLVDPASSHMLVSKIKPCMSQCKLQYGKTVNGSLKQL